MESQRSDRDLYHYYAVTRNAFDPASACMGSDGVWMGDIINARLVLRGSIHLDISVTTMRWRRHGPGLEARNEDCV